MFQESRRVSATSHIRQLAMQVRFWQRLFRQIHEYLGRDALDVLACITAKLETVKAAPRRNSVDAGLASTTASSMNAGPNHGDEEEDALSSRAKNTKLRLTLRGDSSLMGVPQQSSSMNVSASGAGYARQRSMSRDSTSSAPAAAPIYLVNEINLLTILDSAKLFAKANRKQVEDDDIMVLG